MQDVDGRHFLSGAPEAACPTAKPHNVLLVCILPLQPHHGEAADAAECGPGRRPVRTFFMAKVDIDLNSVQFIDEPLAYLTVYHTRVAEYISPNGMSFIGVIFGALAARFFIKEDLKYRQFGVFLFAVSSLYKTSKMMNYLT